MKRITTILFLLLGLSLSAQELISNIQSEGNLQRYKLIEVEDKSYILSFDALDSIKIFEVHEDGQTLTNSHYMIGSYNQYFYRVFGKWLLLEGAKDAFALNILTGEEKVFVSEDGFFVNRWRAYENYAVLRQSLPDFSETVYHLIDKEMQVVDTDDWYNNLSKTTDEYAVVEKREGDDKVIYRADIMTHELWEVTRFGEGERYALSASQIFGLKGNSLKLIDIVGGDSEDLYTMTFDPFSTKFYNLENYFVFTAYKQGNAVTVVYSKESKKLKIWPYELREFIRKSPPDLFIFDNSEAFDSAYIYNFETEAEVAFPAMSIEQSILIGDQYLINRYLFDFLVYDIELNTTSSTTGDFPWGAVLSWESLQKGNTAYVYRETSDETLNELATLDISNAKFSNPNLADVRRGLHNQTQLFKLGEDVIVGNNEHIYNVIDDEVIQLDLAPIIESSYQPFARRGNQLFWAEDEDSLVYFYSFEDGEKNLEAIFGIGNSPVEPDNFWVRYFVNGINTILIQGLQGFDYKTVLLNKETGNAIDINDIPYNHINGARFNKDYFYDIDEVLYAVDETGELHTIDIPVGNFLFGGSTVFDDEFFVSGLDGLYLVDGLNATKVLSHGSDIFGALFEVIAGNLVYTVDNQGFIYKDGVWNEWTKLEDVWYNNFDDEYLQVVKSTGTNLTETQLFHIESNEYIELPEEIRERRLVSRFTSFDKQYIISYVGFLPTYDVKIHEISEDFSTVEEVHSFQSVGRGLSAHFEEFDNEGFLYIGNKLFLMNEDLEFIPLEGVFGDTENVTAVEKEGYFYFIGFHPELGRQVWSVQAFSERVSVDDLNKMALRVYPNPTNQLLHFSDESNLFKGNYRIYSISGKEVDQGQISSLEGIDVSHLASGFYYLKYYNENDKIFTAPFVKQ